ncbi:uncharacterized protein LOC126083423 [Elephas maximus indicus]|uniref:uncharacterized protein LOC126083423 n=1 Tax=Elephas maximus indicus TaxID=99487 RepID=UPI002116B806|nr:uncharacterized protein LOC126083423 [Elephas maximus indicus]
MATILIWEVVHCPNQKDEAWHRRGPSVPLMARQDSSQEGSSCSRHSALTARWLLLPCGWRGRRFCGSHGLFLTPLEVRRHRVSFREPWGLRPWGRGTRQECGLGIGWPVSQGGCQLALGPPPISPPGTTPSRSHPLPALPAWAEGNQLRFGRGGGWAEASGSLQPRTSHLQAPGVQVPAALGPPGRTLAIPGLAFVLLSEQLGWGGAVAGKGQPGLGLQSEECITGLPGSLLQPRSTRLALLGAAHSRSMLEEWAPGPRGSSPGGQLPPPSCILEALLWPWADRMAKERLGPSCRWRSPPGSGAQAGLPGIRPRWLVPGPSPQTPERGDALLAPGAGSTGSGQLTVGSGPSARLAKEPPACAAIVCGSSCPGVLPPRPGPAVFVI